MRLRGMRLPVVRIKHCSRSVVRGRPLDLLRFKTAPDFEMPQDADRNNVYILILTATSGVGDRKLTANQTLTITVTDVGEPPTRHRKIVRRFSRVPRG